MSVRITITGGGLYGADGKEIPVGTELTVKKEPVAWAGRYNVVAEGEAKAKGGKKAAVTNPATYEAKAKDDAFVIVDGNGTEHGAPLSEDDAKAFNDMSDEDKADFVKQVA